MPGKNWQQVEDIFLRAADLPPADRDIFLQGACNGDAELRLEVESLLRADTAGDSAISAAIESEAAALLDESSLIGTHLGPYRLLREIARGGMGTVYIAERDDRQYRKQVAVKVVKRGMDTAEVMARFRHERQILAGLEHPYIARLIDGGATEDGRPFFVMEHVEGQSIDVYCAERKLDLQSRLRLFLRVCEAVSYAHRSLVIHRDLKPGNILVTAEGVPKLLDFGVGKLLQPGADPGMTLASQGGPLTPEYASPEQVRGLPMTTTADVYALGAILFELLTGTRAQKIETTTPAEIERIVCQTEVPRPSAVAQQNNMPFRLPRDLDNIILMAMRKEQERRYQSVDQLAADIEHHLECRPVVARQDSFAYRAQKFMLRHRLTITAFLLIFFSLIAGVALAVTQARRADAARALAESEKQVAEAQKRAAERERARAELETQVAENERARAQSESQVARTEEQRAERRLAEMLELSDRSLYDVHSAIEKLPGATEARRQIVATTLKFLEDLSKDAGQDERLQYMLSVSYSKVAGVLGYPLRPNLGDSSAALANYQKSLALIKPLLARHPDQPEYLLQWIDAQTEQALLLDRTGDRKRAIAELRELLPAAHRLAGIRPQDAQSVTREPDVYNQLSEILSSQDSQAALEYARRETELYESAWKKFPESTSVQLDLASSYSQQAKILNFRSDPRRAIESFQRAVSLREGYLQRHPTDVLTRRLLMITYGNLGGTLGSPFYLNLGDTAGAREYYGKALAIARDLAKADSNDQLAQFDLAYALLFFSSLDSPQDQWAESLSNLQEADRILQKLIAADPRSVTKSRALAMVEEYEGRRLEGLGRKDDAIAEYRQSLALAETGLSRNPSDLSLTSQAVASGGALAVALAKHGDRADAVETARKTIARAESVKPPESERDRVTRFVAMAYESLAAMHASLGNWEQARPAAERAVAEWTQLFSRGSRHIDQQGVARTEALLQECKNHLP